jgi:hypothetical protein
LQETFYRMSNTLTNSFCFAILWQMLKAWLKRESKVRKNAKRETLMQDSVKKVLAGTDQKLIVMVRN